MSASRQTESQPATAKANSIRLDITRLNTLLDALDGKDGQRAAANRQYVRWPFRHTWVSLTVTHAGGSKATIGVACRNISCGGLSILHNSYVHPGRACQVNLPHVAGHTVDVAGKIRRCNHLSGIVHEVGIQFDELVRIGDYVTLGPNAAAFSLERVDPKTLRGTIFAVGGSPLDQKLITHHLRDTAVRVRCFSSADDAVAAASAGVDLIVIDADFDAKHDPTFVTRIQSAGVIAPILGIINGTAQKPGARISADAVIAKPIVQSVLLQAVAEFMSMEDGKGLVCTSLPPGHPSVSLLEGFIDEVRQQADMLEEAIRAQSADFCINICQQVAGIAPVVGFDGLATIARQAQNAADSAKGVQGAMGELRRLIACCRRIKRFEG